MNEFAQSSWIADAGEYLMRIVPYGGGGLMFWWNYPGLWTGFLSDSSSCPSPTP